MLFSTRYIFEIQNISTDIAVIIQQIAEIVFQYLESVIIDKMYSCSFVLMQFSVDNFYGLYAVVDSEATGMRQNKLM